MATTTIARWGNSLGLRIPKDIAERVQLREGDEVEIDSVDGRISIAPRSATDLERLIAAITPENLHGESFPAMVESELW